ncbi:MAG: hypothetical protein R6U67_11110 [Sodalinema sp.]|uniref:hypothetical protein n=1 Tax=Sodalinema sp. TaxID=3080550 RepID=UPI0011FF8AA3|nr:MAG: hypothetical protein EYR95_18300 [Phormidium sp. SL48-SHIP]
MSEPLKIGLVAEGPTDYEVIQAALKAVLPDPFIMTSIQPEATRPQLGSGWCGVLKWCHTAQQRHTGSLDTDPTLSGFDLLIIHVDVDVSSFRYDDCGESALKAQDNNWETLPCSQPCPPILDTVDALLNVIKSWLGPVTPGDRTLFCLPAQSSGTWLAAAVLSSNDSRLTNAECNPRVEKKLEQLPKKQRIRKNKRSYRVNAPKITENWEQVKRVCSQAADFEQAIGKAVDP